MAFIVAMAEDRGLVSLDWRDDSYDQWAFIEFLKKVRKMYDGRKWIAFYMDNAPFHTANSVKNYCSEHRIEIIYSPPYMPQY